MWPPMPGSSRFARVTIAMAFQRSRLLMRRSSERLPGNTGCCDRAMVLMYGVLAVKGMLTPFSWA